MLQACSKGNPDASFVARGLTFGSGASELFESLFFFFFVRLELSDQEYQITYSLYRPLLGINGILQAIIVH